MMSHFSIPNFTPYTVREPSTRQRFRRILNAVGKWAIANLAPNNDPKITCYRHQDGRKYWRVYDPYSGLSTTCHSEMEVRHWLDQRWHNIRD